MKSFKLAQFILFFLVLLSCQNTIPISIETKHLSDRLTIFKALNVNVTVISSAKGLIIVDTQRSPGIMSEVLQAVKKESGRSEVLYVINTHGHWDHCSGNQLFPDSIIIGQENCAEYIRQFPANALTNMWSVRDHIRELNQKLATLQADSEQGVALRSEIAGRQRVLEDLEMRYVPTPPGKIFKDSMTLKLGDVTVKMIYAGNAHTNHDIFIYIPEEKTVITGDLFSTKSYFGFRINQMADIDRMVTVIDQILTSGSGVERIITSHTDMLTGKDLLTIKTSIQEKYKSYKFRKSAAKLMETLIRKYQIAEALEEYKSRVVNSREDYYLLEEEFSVLGRRLMGEGRTEAALTIFRLQSESFPESALAYDNLGEVYLKLGKMDLAIQHYEISLRILPYNRNAEEILKIIRRDGP